MMDMTFIRKSLKYLIQVCVVYLVVRFLTKNKLEQREALLVSLALTLACVAMENSYAAIKTEPMTNVNVVEQQQNSQGNGTCGCAVRENFADTTQPIASATPVTTAIPPTIVTAPGAATPDAPVVAPTLPGTVPVAAPTINSAVSAATAPPADTQRYPPHENDLKYDDAHILPVPRDYKSKEYEYGYSILPPENWYPQPPRPPVCVTDNRCPVCPTFTSNGVLDLKEWDDSRKIMGPANINVEYVQERLNKNL